MDNDIKSGNKEKKVYIEEEIRAAYLDYSMSVIVSRALPDVRDGLKPVHRRILFAMNEMGITHKSPFKKSARIVGDVLGKYHPHGDSSVYNAMVRMAQDFNMRYELVDGHGNFGSVDGDEAAAMRYTEVRMSEICEEMLSDIEKQTVSFRKNFDESLDEPTVLPAKLPNLLLNGASGIAVGMATNIPPHNIGEVCDAIIALTDNPEITAEELMTYIKGPDFPTGGKINGKSGILEAYRTGKGKIRISGKVHMETDGKGKERIIITELPYQVNKARLVERIAQLVREKKITGISDLWDESDREGIRIVIELKRDSIYELVLNSLYKYTELQTTFGINCLALVDNVPKILSLKGILENYLKHRQEIIRKRTMFDLNKSENRLHILDGFFKTLENIEQVIEMIRSSENSEEARKKLTVSYGFSEIQAKAVLDMRLNRITALEKEKLLNEIDEITKVITNLKRILSAENEIRKIIRREIQQLKKKYSDGRKTVISEETNEIVAEDLVKDEEVVIIFTEKGYLKRMPLEVYRNQKRGGVGIISANVVEDDMIKDIYIARNLDNLLFFSNFGKVYKLKTYEIPETGRQARGKLVENIIPLEKNEKINTLLMTRDFSKEKTLHIVTRKGKIKRSHLGLFEKIKRNGKRAIKLSDDDETVFAGISDGKNINEIFIVTSSGYLLKFPEYKIKILSLNSYGINSIKINENDYVVNAGIIEPENFSKQLLTLSENGYGKRTEFRHYRNRVKNRTTGIPVGIFNEKTGKFVTAGIIEENQELVVITDGASLIRTSADRISRSGRKAFGVKIMNVREGEKVISFAINKENEE